MRYELGRISINFFEVRIWIRFFIECLIWGFCFSKAGYGFFLEGRIRVNPLGSPTLDRWIAVGIGSIKNWRRWLSGTDMSTVPVEPPGKNLENVEPLDPCDVFPIVEIFCPIDYWVYFHSLLHLALSCEVFFRPFGQKFFFIYAICWLVIYINKLIPLHSRMFG